MRRMILPFAVLALALLPVTAAAERVAVVDVNYLMEHAPQARAAGQQIQQALGPAQQEMQEKQQEYQELAEELERDELVMGEDEREQIQARMAELEQELQQMQQQLQQQVGQQRQQAMGQIQELISGIVAEIAEEEGYEVVVGQGVLYASDGVDLTDRVLQRLEERAGN